MRFAVFPLHLSTVLRLPRKSEARSYKVLHLSRKIISANLKIWCSKMQSLSGNQRPDLRTALMKMSLVLRLPRKLHLYRSSSNVPRLPTLLQMLQNLTFCSLLARCRIPCACHAKPTSEPSKVVRHWGAFNMLTWKCASRHNGAHFLNISTSKRVPRLMCFVHFDLENVLRATTACNFSSGIWPDGSAPAASASLLLDPREPQIIGKIQCFATFLPFRAPASSFFWLFLFSDFLSSCLLFSDFSHLCFSMRPYCRKFDF